MEDNKVIEMAAQSGEDARLQQELESGSLDALLLQGMDAEDPAAAQPSGASSSPDGPDAGASANATSEPAGEKTPETASPPAGDSGDDTAVSPEEIARLRETERLYQQLREQQAADTFRRVYQAQLDGGMTEEIARIAAREAAGGKTYPLDAARTAATTARSFDVQLSELRQMYPDLSEIPETVTQQWVAGKGELPMLYTTYQVMEQQRTISALQEQLSALAENTRTAAHAPVRPVSNGPAAAERADEFLAGFNLDD